MTENDLLETLANLNYLIKNASDKRELAKFKQMEADYQERLTLMKSRVT